MRAHTHAVTPTHANTPTHSCPRELTFRADRLLSPSTALEPSAPPSAAPISATKEPSGRPRTRSGRWRSTAARKRGTSDRRNQYLVVHLDGF